jgi:hypothetical protein
MKKWYLMQWKFLHKTRVNAMGIVNACNGFNKQPYFLNAMDIAIVY